MIKNVDPFLAEILRAVMPPFTRPCQQCGSLDCGPVRCRFVEPKADERAAK